jgi:iron complex outermembrane receptor protein
MTSTIKSFLWVIVGLFASAIGVAQAADTSTTGTADENLAEVVVTGTRIRGVTSAGTEPITLSRDDLLASGLATTSDLTRALPQVINLGADESRLGGAQDGAANTTRIAGINLRGIGNEATLLLINGRRIAAAGVIKALSDPNVIPAAAVERLEVVADGASAIYGSDAVAGVVNIITRKNFSGAETSLRYGSADSLSQKVASQTFGKAWGSGSLFVALEYNHRSNLSGADRDFATWDRSARGGSDARSNLASPGNILSGTTRYPLPAGNGIGLTSAQLVAGTANRFDDGKYVDLLPEQKRSTAFLDARHQISNWEFWYQGFYTKRDFVDHVAPASGQLRVPNTNAFFVAPAALGAVTFVNVEYRFLAEDANPQLIGFENAQQNAVGAGVDLGHEWRLESSLSFSSNHGFQSRGAITNGAALTAALASMSAATAFNAYGNGSYNVSNNPALVDIIIANRDTTAHSTNRDYLLNADGPLLSLPGGKVRLAVGVERHESRFRQQLDATNVLATGAVTSKFVNNPRSNDSQYAELFIPLISESNAMAGARRLNLSLAVRRDDYSDFGNTTNPKYGLTWLPIDSLTLRASYGTSFRAPSLVDTSQQIHNIFIQNLTDPTGVGGITRGLFHNGGRATLQPEAARTWSFSTEWKPHGALAGLSVGASYYRVDYDNRIDVVPATALTAAAVYAPFIVRRPAATDVAGTVAFNALVTAFLADPDLQSPVEPIANINAIVDGRRANLGGMKQNGVDVNLGYVLDTSAGKWRLGLDAARILTLERSIAPGLPFTDVLDTFGNPVALRMRATVGWSGGPWATNVFLNSVGGYLNTAIAPNTSVSSYRTLDATVNYRYLGEQSLLKGTTISLAIQDLFNSELPVVLNGTVSWDNQNVSPIGRMVALTVGKNW